MDSQDESNTVTDDVGCSEKDDSTELEMKDGGEPEEEEEEEEQEEDGEVCDSPYETEEEHTTETESEDDGEGTSSNHSERYIIIIAYELIKLPLESKLFTSNYKHDIWFNS